MAEIAAGILHLATMFGRLGGKLIGDIGRQPAGLLRQFGLVASGGLRGLSGGAVGELGAGFAVCGHNELLWLLANRPMLRHPVYTVK